jgi:hypothetical protein
VSQNQVPIAYSPAASPNPAKVSFKGRDAAIVYKANATNIKNTTINGFFKFAKSNATYTLIRGFDNLAGTGIKVIATATGTSMVVSAIVNNVTTVFSAFSFSPDEWYAIFVPISAEYKQAALYVYSFVQDPANSKNWTGISQVTKQVKNLYLDPGATVSAQSNWELISGPYSVANIRVFNTMVQEEDHEFVLSQQYLRDESMLILVDNCKPRLNIPFISINR